MTASINVDPRLRGDDSKRKKTGRYWIFSSSIISRTKRTGGAP